MASNDEVSRLTSALSDLFSDLANAVVREKPRDLIDYVANHFTRMRDERRAKSVPLYVVVDDDELASEPDREQFQPKAVKRVRDGWRGSVASESYDPEAADNDHNGDAEIDRPLKTTEQRHRLMEAVKRIFLFRSLDDELMNRVIDAMFERKVAPGDYVIRQGDPGDNFYVIENGVFDVIKKGCLDSERIVRLDGRGCFGELALMYNQPRSASVVAVTSGILWAMDRLSFRRIVLQSTFRKRQMYDQLLKAVPMLTALCDYERATLADALRSQTYPDGACIIREGDLPADGMYFIEKGAARVTIRTDNEAGQKTEKTVASLGVGDYFGEMALLDDRPRTASVYASTDELLGATADGAAAKDEGAEGGRGKARKISSSTDGMIRVAFLEREAFERLLGPCINVMVRKSKSYVMSESGRLEFSSERDLTVG